MTSREDQALSSMDPQHQLIYMLGELRGEVRAMREALSAQTSRQTEVNAETSTRLGEHDRAISEHAAGLAVLNAAKSSQAPRLTWPQVLTGVGAIGALVVLVLTLFPNFIP